MSKILKGRVRRVLAALRTLAWIACVIYSTIPSFWLLIHPWAEFWRSRRTSPYKILLPCWIGMWIGTAAITAPWRSRAFYENSWTWIPAIFLFCGELLLYWRSGGHFSLAQLGGVSEIVRGDSQQNLVTRGVRARVRHPVYLGHLCEMLAWSAGTGLRVCWVLTAWAVFAGIVMIAMEDKELENRFGEEYRQYRSTVPPVFPKVWR